MVTAKRAEAGIGTLILFIAMILVAAVAAGVLLQTSNSLQSKALSTGSQAKAQVTTGLQYLSIYADDGDDGDNSLENFYIEVKLIPGSDIIKLSDGIIELAFIDGSVSYNASAATVNDCALTGTEFQVQYLKNGTNHIDQYLTSGDIARLCINASRNVGEDEEVDITFIPKTGLLTRSVLTTPSVIIKNTVYMFP